MNTLQASTKSEIWFGGRWRTETPYLRKHADKKWTRRARVHDVPTIAAVARNLSVPLEKVVVLRYRPVRKPFGWSLRQVRAAESRELRRNRPIRSRNMPMQTANRGLYMGESGHGQDLPRFLNPVGHRNRKSTVGEKV